MSTEKKPKKGKNYVDNEALYNAFVEWHAARKIAEEQGKPEPEVPRIIAESIVLIPTRLATKGNFSGYTYKDEMVGDAIENITTYFRNFDPEKSKNPFSYFTQISYFAFIRRISIEKKAQYVKQKAIANSGLADIVMMQDHDLDQDIHINMLELLQQNHNEQLDKMFDPKPRKKRKAVDFDIESLFDTDEEEIDE